MSGIHLAIESVGTKHGGGAAVLQGLLTVLVKDPRFAKITVYVSPRSCRDFDLPESDRLVGRERPREERSYAARIIWYRWGLAGACRSDNVDLVLCANGMGVTENRLPRVAMVQQALPYCDEALALLSVAHRFRLAVVRLLTCSALRSATAVVAQSPAMVETLRTRCGLAGAKVAVCVPSVSTLAVSGGHAAPGVMAACPADRRLLYVGNNAPYKNVERVAGAMARLRKRLPGATLFVTLSEDDSLCRAEGVVGLGHLRGAELAATYAAATVVVQPSLVESGPLVPHEALRAGRPLLVADRPWAHDACGGAAVLFDPHNGDEFVDQAALLLTDTDLRERLVETWAARRRAASGKESYEGLADLLEWAYRDGHWTSGVGNHV